MTHIQKREILHLREQGLGYAQIAEAVGLPKNTVKTFCWRNQQPTKAELSAEIAASQCPQCGNAIEQVPRQKPRRFCCEQCRRAWWNARRDVMRHRDSRIAICNYCGQKFDHRGDPKRRYCTHSHYIAARFGGQRS